jgi:hypothetical protein
MRRSFKHIQQARTSEAFFLTDDFNLNHLSHEGAGHKDDALVRTCNANATIANVLNLNLHTPPFPSFP